MTRSPNAARDMISSKENAVSLFTGKNNFVINLASKAFPKPWIRVTPSFARKFPGVWDLGSIIPMRLAGRAR